MNLTTCLRKLSLIFAMSIAVSGYSNDVDAGGGIANSGFSVSNRRVLQKHFPACNEFLEVRWIAPKKRIGIVRFDMFDRQGIRTAQRVSGIIFLDDLRPTLDYSLALYREKIDGQQEAYKKANNKELAGLFMSIQSGVVDSSKQDGLRITLPGKSIEFVTLSEASEELGGKPMPTEWSLSNYTKTICVAYPDKRLAWIVELPKVATSYSAEEAGKLFEKLKASLPNAFPPEQTRFVIGEMIDVNADGVKDYVDTTLIYSNGESFVGAEPQWRTGADSKIGVWKFPNTGKECMIFPMNGHRNFTTDGKSVFSGFNCNLTSLTTWMGK